MQLKKTEPLSSMIWAISPILDEPRKVFAQLEHHSSCDPPYILNNAKRRLIKNGATCLIFAPTFCCRPDRWQPRFSCCCDNTVSRQLELDAPTPLRRHITHR
jgi:hypothetical protein